MTKISVEVLTIRGARLEGENPLPMFRREKQDIDINFRHGFPEEKKEKAGYQTGFRVLPYRMQDRFSRTRIPMQFKMIVLENEYLAASFLPEVGGRLYSLYDKVRERELLSCNPVFQPANVAIRNAWVSGGIEWNIGQLGHAFHTSASVFAAFVDDPDEGAFLRIYDFERCKGVFWQIDFHLPKQSNVLFAHVKVLNPSDASIPMYWWTNIAVRETPDVRVFAPADDIIYLDPDAIGTGKGGFGYGRMPVVPFMPDVDVSYPVNFGYANEYFFQCPEIRRPWEAAVYKNGETFFEVSTDMLRYRKMFCWGSHKGGRHWQEFLSEPGNEYIEIQGGLAPTQLHGIDMPGNAVWEWTQGFGGTDVDASTAHDADWFAARDHIADAIDTIVSEQTLYENHREYGEKCNTRISELVHEGSGWGALECERLQQSGSQSNPAFRITGMDFPASTIGHEQYPWLNLLREGCFPEADPTTLPGAWMIQKEWRVLLESSLEDGVNRTWLSLLHAGVMAFEAGDIDMAIGLWKESAEKRPSVWAYRNLAVAMNRVSGPQATQHADEALIYMEKVFELPEKFIDKAFSEEYLQMLLSRCRYDDAWRIYNALPSGLRNSERILLLAGFVAVEIRELKFVEQLFDYDFATIREGELSLTDLWYRYHEARLATERDVEIDPALKEEVRKTCPIPSRLDFASSED